MVKTLSIDKNVSHRKPPVNIVSEDEYLFAHEYMRVNAEGNLYLFDLGIVSGYNINTTTDNSNVKYDKCFFVADVSATNYFHWFGDTCQKFEFLFYNYIRLKYNEDIDFDNYSLLIPNSWLNIGYIAKTLKYYEFNVIGYEVSDSFTVSNLIYVPNIAEAGNYNDMLMYEMRNRLSLYAKPLTKIYISRSKARYRKITNEHEVQNLMSQYGVLIVHCEELSWESQQRLMSSCKYLISLHGAGLTNMLFMNSNTNVLEIRGKGDFNNNCYYSLACALNLNYYYNEADNVSNNFHLGDCVVDIGKLEGTLKQMLQGDI